VLSTQMSQKITEATKICDGSFYFYDLDLLDAHVKMLSCYNNQALRLYYACKANPLSSILTIIKKYDLGLDIASLGELHQAVTTNFKRSQILATGPAKSKCYIKKLVENNISTIVIESLNQLTWLQEIAKNNNVTIKVLLRLQLEWNEGESVLGGNQVTPFGQDVHHWSSINISEFSHLEFIGFHLFQWGNILALNELEAIWRVSIIAMKELAKKLNMNLKVCDLGGGLGVPYKSGLDSLEFKNVYEVLMKLKEEYSISQIYLELGRFLVAECGHYITKIIDIKKVRGKEIIVLENGINHLARSALTKESFPAELLINSSKELATFQVHGPLCTALDHLGDYSFPKSITIGDFAVFRQTGAYGFTESMPYFLAHPLAAEVISCNNELIVIRPSDATFSWMR
jgi:diaminopimelate decarboxylase